MPKTDPRDVLKLAPKFLDHTRMQLLTCKRVMREHAGPAMGATSFFADRDSWQAGHEVPMECGRGA
jgi:hypothetical protein